jgi:hypothetical protein
LPEGRQLAQEQRGQRWSAAAPDLMRYRARLGGRAGDRLLHQDGTPRSRRLHAQGRPLVGGRADHHRVCAVDRGLDTLYRGR